MEVRQGRQVENGVEVKECPFLNEYTKDVIELFFFNGETILNIVKKKNFIKYVNQLIEISFNLNTFNQLQKDVDKSISNDYKEMSSDKFSDLEKEIKRREKQLENLKTKVRENNELISTYTLNYKHLKKEMERFNVLDDLEVQSLLKDEQEIKSRINTLKNQVEEFKNVELNHQLVKCLNSKLTDELEETRKTRVNEIINSYEKIGEEHVTLKNMINFNLEHEIVIQNKKNHQFDSQGMIATFEDIKSEENNLIEVRKQLHASEEGRKFISTEDNLNHFRDKIMEVENELKKDLADMDKVEINIEALKNEYELEKKNILKNSLQANAIGEKDKLTKLIDAYITRRKVDIYKQLNVELNHILKEVFRKSNLIEKVNLTDQALEIMQKKKQISFEQFSAGEQQMLIVAVILSIIKVSNNLNPLVLDTFIGRLDSSHTKNVLTYLSEEIQNQVLILTTDKEITEREYYMFEPKINCAYTLTNDGYKTILTEGYFNYANQNK